MNIKILHTADIQVQCRDKNLKVSYEKALKNIEEVLKTESIDVYLIAGDLFEYAVSNEIEKKILYQHLSRALTIDTLKEIVIMAGNHDLEKMKHVKENEEEENSINTFAETINALDDEYARKLNYLKRAVPTPSFAHPSLVWYPYSLEDQLSLKDCPNIAIENIEELRMQGKYVVTIFHDILKEYATSVKLPLTRQRMDSLYGMEDFHTPVILAGDIHLDWEYTDEKGKRFVYPGSPVQRNFGEGSYFRVGKDVITVDADKKYVKIHEFDPDRLTLESTGKIELTDMVTYNTVETLQDVTIESFFTSLEKIIDNFKYGKEQTFIKLKLSNIFVSRELEIHKLITMKTRDRKRVNIEVTYAKFVNTSSTSMIDKILGVTENTDENVTEDQQENNTDTDAGMEPTFDNLVLNDKQLRKLFMHVLDSRFEKVAKEYAADKKFLMRVYASVMELFDQEINECLSGVKKINVELESVECNNFMSLGSNKIILNAPGITRVIGTNGIGKTTLYNMLRWTIRNMVFEGMSKAQVKKNTLIAFNNKLPEIDDVAVILHMRVNNVPVTITRKAQRTWKRNVTMEQKLSLEWKEQIQTVTSELEITIHKETGDKTFIGDQAQMYIDAWFGDAPETIMFINYVKILQTLNTSPKELNDLILNFIGVDYLDKMESRIPSIKENLMITRPKRVKEEIKASIIDKEQAIDKTTNLIKEKNTVVDNINNEIKNTRVRLNDKIEELQVFGDLEKNIVDKGNLLENTKLKIRVFDTWEIKQPVPFDAKAPDVPDMSIIEKEISDKDFDKERLVVKKESLEKKLVETRGMLISNYNETMTTVGAARDQMKESITVKTRQLQDLETLVVSKSSEISSGVCPTCNRPYDDPELFELKKRQAQAEIEKAKEDIVLCKRDREERQDKYELIAKKYLDLQTARDLLSMDNYDAISEVNDARLSMLNVIKTLKREIIETGELIVKTEHDIKLLNARKETINTTYTRELKLYNDAVMENTRINNEIQEHNNKVADHNKELDQLKHDAEMLQVEFDTLKSKLTSFDIIKNEKKKIEEEIQVMENTQRKENESLTMMKVDLNQLTNDLQVLNKELEDFMTYVVNNQIFTLYNNLVKTDFKVIVFEYYRNFLNNSLNNLLEDVNFKLFFNNDSELYMIRMGDGNVTYTPCQQTSGMETVFLGLSLIYMMSVLNIKNSINLICIDELSGQLNNGKGLTYEAKDYCDLFVKILSRFTKKNIIIVDHQIDNMFETLRYEVVGTAEGSKFIAR